MAPCIQYPMALLMRCWLELGSPKGLVGLFRPSPLLWGHSQGRTYSTSAATAPAIPDDRHEMATGDTSDGCDPPSPSKVAALKQKGWTKSAKRCGVIAIKLGMTQLWDKEGHPLAVTVLQVRTRARGR